MMEVFCLNNNKTYDITNMVQSAEIKGSKYKTARSLTLSVLNSNRGLHKSLDFQEGDTVLFRWKGSELIQGTIFKIGQDKSEVESILVYDLMIYLLRNNESYVFTNKKASEIARTVCSDFGIPIGSIIDTGYVIPSLVCDAKNLYDIIMQALEMTRKQTGVNHYLYAEKGKLYIVRRIENIRKWVIENGVNLIDYSYERSIEGTFTKVKLSAEQNDTTLIATADNGELQKRFGMLQYFEKVSDTLTQSQLNDRAKELMKQKSEINKSFSLTALGISDIISGTSIYVIEKKLKVSKGYFVDEDTHTFKGKEHTMSLKLTETDKLPEVSL